jgi:UDP-N-acetylglucosamine 4,6-dehydratase
VAHNVLITGGTGSLGTVLSQRMVELGYNVSILNKDSHKQALFRKTQTGKAIVRYYLGDICDTDLLLDACRHQDVVIHGAAIKRIEMVDAFCDEAVRVNIEGTRNVARACIAQSVNKCLLISSDKSTSSSTLYGSTKAVAEGLWLHRHNLASQCLFSTIRYGNVINSQGSVWWLWHNAKSTGQPLLVRVPDPTRFILTLNQAVDLVLNALDVMDTYAGCVYIPSTVPTFSLHDLAREIEPDVTNWELHPLMINEKRHEILLAPDECAKRVSQKLWATCARYEMEPWARAQFSSDTAKRLTGKEVVEMMKGNT